MHLFSDAVDACWQLQGGAVLHLPSHHQKRVAEWARLLLSLGVLIFFLMGGRRLLPKLLANFQKGSLGRR